MVIARNNVIDDFVFDPEILVIPDRYKVEPANFKVYTWESQDGRIVGIKEFDDNHLINLFKMLGNTILYAMELRKHNRLSYEANSVVKAADHNLKYIGHELHLRQQVFITKKLSSTKLNPQQ